LANTIKLQVLTPTKLMVDEEVDEVVAPGELGEFGVLVGHIPLVTTLAPGEVKYKMGAYLPGVPVNCSATLNG